MKLSKASLRRFLYLPPRFRSQGAWVSMQVAADRPGRDWRSPRMCGRCVRRNQCCEGEARFRGLGLFGVRDIELRFSEWHCDND